MELRFLTLFVEVARAGGFAAAARKLDLDASVVSRAVASLEKELELRLFQRTTRTVTLTEAGARFLSRVEPLLAELQSTCQQASEESAAPKGRLSLSASVAFGQCCVMPHIPEFLDRYPEVELNLVFTDRQLDLIAERVDLSIRLVAEVGAEMEAVKLRSTRYLVCASPAYLDAHGAPTAPQALEAHRCVCFDLPGYRTRWLFRQRSGAVLEAPITPRLTLSGGLAVREACLAGLGPALMADWLVRDDIASGRLLDLFPGVPATATTFDTAAWLLYPSRNFLPLNTRVLIAFLREKLSPS